MLVWYVGKWSKSEEKIVIIAHSRIGFPHKRKTTTARLSRFFLLPFGVDYFAFFFFSSCCSF